MIVLTVLSYNGAPSDGLSGSFDELGGTIGRADNNQLVLPDPERTISRVHAQIVFRGGRYAIVDRGSNPISVNGRPLGNGQEAPLQGGAFAFYLSCKCSTERAQDRLAIRGRRFGSTWLIGSISTMRSIPDRYDAIGDRMPTPVVNRVAAGNRDLEEIGVD